MPIRAVLYPALQEPVLPSGITPDRWYVQWRDPVRRGARALTVAAIVASGMTIDPWALTRAEATTVDRWFQPFSEPRWSRKPIPAGARPSFWWSDQAATLPEATAVDKWFAPASEPVRVRRSLRAALQQASALDPWALTQPEATTLDRWFSPASEPVRSRPALRRGSLPASFFDPYPLPPSNETVTLDKWFAPPSEPVRRRKLLGTASQAAFVIDPWALTQPEATSSDRWLQPFGQRLPQPARSHAARMPGFFIDLAAANQTAETVTVDKWFVSFSQPVRAPRMRAALQALPLSASFQPATDVILVDRWFVPFSEPLRKAKRWIAVIAGHVTGQGIVTDTPLPPPTPVGPVHKSRLARPRHRGLPAEPRGD